MGPKQSIISMTDLKGQITYVNKDFLDISGFTEDELIGQSHNIVRHPDMPPAAYKDLWGTVKAGKPWRGMVKNRCKNGDHYWVDAFVTPVVKQGTVVGYQSVRSKPSQNQIRQAEALYKRVKQSKLDDLPKKRDLRLRTSVEFKLLQAVWLGLLAAALATGNFSDGMLYGMIAAGLVLMGGCFWWIDQRLIKPLHQLVAHTKAIANGDLSQVIELDRIGAMGEIQTGMKMIQGRLKAVIGRIQESSLALSSSADQLAAMSVQADRSMQTQMSETEQIATAMQEMTATVQEVANNCSMAADSAAEADRCVSTGDQVVQQTQNSIRTLATEVEQAEEVIQSLHADANNIGSILDVIRGVAEQTNLLALNAAIEAARAGEQGRGFAVVADEVRSLAQRTQSSTEEIQQMIEGLQRKADSAVKVMQQGRSSADHSVAEAQQAAQSLIQIREAVARISDMSTQIATAAEEQSAVSEEMNRNIVKIRSLSDETSTATAEGARSAAALSETTHRLNTVTGDYEV
ncbi:methyl-accepting chemotaxis protein [Motiliproteus sediminis]|uniref:methyl-accepting chemotaxis protein n=1 Tax=Motiliproteus sediminis TaxID=1468178 RepID=UPI001AEF6AB1|nr:PAS domain-containing methyl-accepting chemotaxis protein [Motiliproteus sediminis]